MSYSFDASERDHVVHLKGSNGRLAKHEVQPRLFRSNLLMDDQWL
jgi:hypothetical protein